MMENETTNLNLPSSNANETTFANNNIDEEEFFNEPLQQYSFEEHSVLRRFQTYCGIFSHALSLISIGTVLHWTRQLGGFASLGSSGQTKLVFNWHPLLMTTAFFFMTVASLSFRFSFCGYLWSDRSMIKLVHGSAWLVAALCATVALIAVVRSHNDKASGYIANLYSLHSWIGVAVIFFYVVQFLVAFFSFGWTLHCVTPSIKATILRIHKFLGPALYLSTAATILLGIQEKEGFVGCSYKVDEADLFPVRHFGHIPAPCRTSHALGLSVLMVAISTSFALYDFSNPHPVSGIDRER